MSTTQEIAKKIKIHNLLLFICWCVWLVFPFIFLIENVEIKEPTNWIKYISDGWYGITFFFILCLIFWVSILSLECKTNINLQKLLQSLGDEKFTKKIKKIKALLTLIIYLDFPFILLNILFPPIPIFSVFLKIIYLFLLFKLFFSISSGKNKNSNLKSCQYV